MRPKDEEKILSHEFLTELRRIREEKAISLEEVAEKTNIKLAYIRAIEEGNLDDLPGGIYNRAYIRSVSEFLGVDTKPFEKKITGEEIFVPHMMEIEFGRGVNSNVPTKTLISICVLCIIMVYLIFFSGSKDEVNETAKTEEAKPVTPLRKVARSNSSTISLVALHPTKITLLNEDEEPITSKDLKTNQVHIYTLDPQKLQEETLLKVDNIENIEIYLNGIPVPNTKEFEKDDEYYILTFENLFKSINFEKNDTAQEIP